MFGSFASIKSGRLCYVWSELAAFCFTVWHGILDWSEPHLCLIFIDKKDCVTLSMSALTFTILHLITHMCFILSSKLSNKTQGPTY